MSASSLAVLLALLASGPTLWAAFAEGDVPASEGLLRFLIAYALAWFALARLTGLVRSYRRIAQRREENAPPRS